MTTRQSFFAEVSLNKSWNRVIEWNGYTIATVQWHQNREWKVVKAGATFDEVKERSYKPIAEFHTQQELWQYIKLSEK